MKIRRNFDFYALLFFLLSFTGWVWEALLYLVSEQRFVNRGIYRGPWLPIYGVGGIVLYLLLHRQRHRPVLVFLLSALFCSALEYFGSWWLETVWKIRWWDYSGYFMNLHGRICLTGGLIFGLGGTLLICLVLPRFESLHDRLPVRCRLTVSLLLTAAFVIDAAYTAMHPNMGSGITTLRLHLF